jgi:N-acetylglucosamine malate deacetylase 2
VTTMVVVAHPDDETLYCGGYIARTTRSGENVVTVTLTRGEEGRTLGLCDVLELGAVRVAELQAAARLLGVNQTEVYELPDGRLAEHVAEATRLMQSALARWRPAAVVTFAPNGINGHPDHIAAHHVVLSSLDKPDGPRLLLMTNPTSCVEPARSGFLTSDQIDRLRLAPTMTIPVDDVLKIKLSAMGCYETQALSVTKRLRHHPEQILTEWFHELDI